MQEIAVLASRALTTQRMFNAVADNIANGTTAGYRKLEMDFKEVSGRGKGGQPGASYTQDRSMGISTLSGVLQSTGNPLDVAITGPGYFAVDVGGSTQYTRRGQFLVNTEGLLVTPEGNPVLDNSNAPIQFPEGIKNITIALDGTISTEEGQLAKIGVFAFTPEQESALQRTGNTGFATVDGSAPTALEYPTVHQGAYESSNVNAVEEMVNMQLVSKAYENTITLLGSLNDLESRAIRNLGTQ
jgi:flagellar basal-body rod protein FlgF